MNKILHIKSPDKRFCTKILATVKDKKIVKIIKVLDISISCKEKE
jgi:hypothetical protein